MNDDYGKSTIDAALADPPADCRRLLVGFSGGMDSTVLLHRLATDRSFAVRAIHVHHGLHPDADRWAQQCRNFCERLGTAIDVVRVHVDDQSGEGLEAAARHARYAAFADSLCSDECLVTAQHQDDQAETVLLRLLRGSGSGGLAAMRALRPFANGWHWRPLLAIGRADLLAYARQHELEWIEDSANADIRHDRNFLRTEVMPVLNRRWPGAAAAMARSAMLLAESEQMLDEQTAHRLAQVQGLDPHTLSVPGLQRTTSAWRARMLRRWIDALGLPALPAAGIDTIERQLLNARPDAVAMFRWRGVAVRRWRDLLYAESVLPDLPEDWQAVWDSSLPLKLPTGACLRLLRNEAASAVAAPEPFRVSRRAGGERIRLPGRTHSHAVKNALQEFGVPPWQRKRLPLVYAADGELLAVGDVLRSARAQAAGWNFRTDERLEPR